jgi:hypothetical protein
VRQRLRRLKKSRERVRGLREKPSARGDDQILRTEGGSPIQGGLIGDVVRAVDEPLATVVVPPGRHAGAAAMTRSLRTIVDTIETGDARMLTGTHA